MNVNEWAHFSVDDVIECFRWIYENEPNSIFEEPMLQKLKEWHEKYKLHCDLYVFEKCDGFYLHQLQDYYWQELGKESYWLKMAWHAPDSGTNMANIKAGTNDENEVLASLERVYDLISVKIGKQAWSNTVRLHFWAALESVLLSLQKKGINVLLTADEERVNYHLDRDNLKLLAAQGSMWLPPFTYRVTDICFDQLDEGVSVQELLNRTEKCLKKHLLKQCLEIFVHAGKLKKVASDIDIYMERFGEIRMSLAAEAGVIIGGTFYFTTYNSCGLYAMDLASKEIKLLTILPCKDWNSRKFVSLCYYQGTIWMIPHWEDKIVTYHLISGKVVMHQMLFLGNQNIWISRFRSVIIEDGKYLWLLPSITKKIIRIDRVQHSLKTYSEWPKEITFSLDESVNFLTMCQQGRKLYLLKYSASHNVIFDMDTGKMEIWGEQFPNVYGIVAENRVIFSPKENKDPLCIYDVKTGEGKEHVLPDWIWDKQNKKQYYAFWYMRQIRNTIYIFPYDANALILYNIDGGTIRWIELDKLDYAMLNMENYKGIADVWEVNQKIYFLSFLNNILIETDMAGNISEHIHLVAPVSNLTGVRINRSKFRMEDNNNFLMDYLSQVINWKCGEWKEVEDCMMQIDYKEDLVGKLIYNEVKQES